MGDTLGDKISGLTFLDEFVFAEESSMSSASVVWLEDEFHPLMDGYDGPWNNFSTKPVVQILHLVRIDSKDVHVVE